MNLLLTESNLTNLSDLIAAINAKLDNKKIPQFAGSETNKVRDWFLKNYTQAVKDDVVDLKSSIKKHQYKDGEPDWMKKPDIMDFTGNLPNDIVDEINHIVDYFATLDQTDLKKIYKEPYKTIKQKVQDWDKELATSSTDTSKEDVAKKSLVKDTDYKIVKEVGNGLKWVKLLTPTSKDVEGDFMGHCVGSVGYENKDIYSLWDKKNLSHVTIEADDKQKTIQQIKGKVNRAPVEKYQAMCVDFVANAMMDGYTVKADGENIDMIKHSDVYHFDDLNILPEKFRDKSVFRDWVDRIFPTIVFPKQQKAIADLAKRIVDI